MERKEFLDILYAERERIYTLNNKQGWSLWILIAALSSLIWLCLNFYNEKYALITQYQVEDLIGAFISIFAITIIVINIFKDITTIPVPSRFQDSQLYILCLNVIFVIATLIYYSCIYENSIYTIGLVIYFSIYYGHKIVEIIYLFKWKYFPHDKKFNVFILIITPIALFNNFIQIHSYYSYQIVNTEYSIIIISIIVILYFVLYYFINPISIKISLFDKLIDDVLTNRDIDIDQSYERFISFKIGFKYGKLFQKRIIQLDKQFQEFDAIFDNIQQVKNEIEKDDDDDKKMNLFSNYLSLIDNANLILTKLLSMQNGFHAKLKSYLNHIPLNRETKQDFNKLLKISCDTLDHLRNNTDIIKKENLSAKEILANNIKPYESSSSCLHANNKL